jgi:hypothetical protein
MACISVFPAAGDLFCVDFRLRLGAGFHVYWTPLLTCLSWALFVWGSVFHYPGHAALILLDPDFEAGCDCAGEVSPLESVGSLDARPKAEHRSESNAHERGSQRLAISASDHRTAKRSGGRMLRLLVFEASITACSHSQTGPNAVNT